MNFKMFDILAKLTYLNRSMLLKSLFIFIVISVMLAPFFINHNIFINHNKNGIKYPIEIIESIEPDTLMGKKYTVKIKRIELKESTYILHTDSTYSLNDTINPEW